MTILTNISGKVIGIISIIDCALCIKWPVTADKNKLYRHKVTIILTN